MLTTSTRLKIQAILKRISKGESVTLAERIYVNKFAEHDRTVSSWLSRARRMQTQDAPSQGLDGFLADLTSGGFDYRDEGAWKEVLGMAFTWVDRCFSDNKSVP